MYKLSQTFKTLIFYQCLDALHFKMASCIQSLKVACGIGIFMYRTISYPKMFLQSNTTIFPHSLLPPYKATKFGKKKSFSLYM
jgi:hypothetical protein